MEVFAKTDVGRVREINEDNFGYGKLDENCVWAVVCDGMGGTRAGGKASSMVVQTLQDELPKRYKDTMGDDEVLSLMSDLLKLANDEVFSTSNKIQEFRGMGTTAILVLARPQDIYIAYVGDSRAYLIEDKKIKKLTEDHSMVSEMVKAGKITREEAKNHPSRNIITRAVGISSRLEVDFVTVKPKGTHSILLCTDGLTNYLEEQEILDLHTSTEKASLPQVLIDEANNLGGSDNITVLLINT